MFEVRKSDLRGRHGGFAADELPWKKKLRRVSHVIRTEKAFLEVLHGLIPHVVAGLGNCGDIGMEHMRVFDVIESPHRQILWDAQTETARGLDCTERETVGNAEQSRRTFRLTEQGVRRIDAASKGIVGGSVDDIIVPVSQTVGTERIAVPLKAQARGDKGVLAADHANFGVAELNELFHSTECCSTVVDADKGELQ